MEPQKARIHKDMDGKFTFAIISDDTTYLYLERSLRRPKWDKSLQEHVLKHLEYKIIGRSLKECLNYEGQADCIILDAGAVSTYMSDRYNSELRKFAQTHSSSIFCIVSLFKSRMEEYFKEVQSYVSDEVVVEMYGNGNEQVADYMYKKVLQYYPYKG
jgi:hypothetical protein